jgi:hypothetical protein
MRQSDDIISEKQKPANAIVVLNGGAGEINNKKLGLEPI